MAKDDRTTTPGQHVIMADGEPLDLKNRYLAAFLGWLIPGAGHYYQGRYFKSAVFFCCILPSFLIGLWISNGNCVYASWNETEVRWQFLLQAGVGLPTTPAMLQGWRARGGADVGGQFMAKPENTNMQDEWHAETASGFDMGTLYTMIAGLLNMLAVFDAYAGPMPPPVSNKKKKKNPDESQDGEASDEGGK